MRRGVGWLPENFRMGTSQCWLEENVAIHNPLGIA
jgi:hypothetical protein